MSSLRPMAVPHRLMDVISSARPRVIACSGGIDSMLLATLAHRADSAATYIVHARSPAVPDEATARVENWADREGWRLEVVETGEFEDEAYLANPVNRCYFCKSHLYETLEAITQRLPLATMGVLMSGANMNDLGEYRPGLQAAAERGVRHPYIEAEITKADIRAIAAEMNLPFAALPASPCLASRLYTGTRVTATRLAAVEAGEKIIRVATGLADVRCRLRENNMLIEVPAGESHRVTSTLVAEVARAARERDPAILTVMLDREPYRPGRAFVKA